MEKIRVDGETIRSDCRYAGHRVIQLLRVSFENGLRRGRLEESEKRSESIRQAFNNGVKFALESSRRASKWEKNQIIFQNMIVIELTCECGYKTKIPSPYCPMCGLRKEV